MPTNGFIIKMNGDNVDIGANNILSRITNLEINLDQLKLLGEMRAKIITDGFSSINKRIVGLEESVLRLEKEISFVKTEIKDLKEDLSNSVKFLTGLIFISTFSSTFLLFKEIRKIKL